MSDFLEWLRPKPRLPAERSPEPVFRGGMSYRCLTEASQDGHSALMLYLLLWHIDKDRTGTVLDDHVCGIAGLSRYQRQNGLPKLSAAGLVAVEIQNGNAPLARVVDPYEGTGRFFGGGMSFRCLVAAFCCHRGGALAVYIAAQLAYTLYGRSGPVRLGKATREDLGMKKSSWNRAVDALEQANLLLVENRSGASPMATPLDPWAPGAVLNRPPVRMPSPATATRPTAVARLPSAPAASRATASIRDEDAAAKAAALEQIRRFQEAG